METNKKGSNKKCTWMEWTLEVVNKDDACPGIQPEGDHGLLTKEEFLKLAGGSLHDHTICGHYLFPSSKLLS